MPTELIAVLGTLCGAIVAGTIGHLATRSAKTLEWKLALAKDQMAIRQRLYSEFLVESQLLVVQASREKLSDIRELNTLNNKFAEISLLSSATVVQAARMVADYVLTSHSINDAQAGKGFYDLKQEFIAAARIEIASYAET